MTDKEKLIELFKKMDLEEKTVNHPGNLLNDYQILDNVIYLGGGFGYCGGYVRFDFDENENIISHSVWE